MYQSDKSQTKIAAYWFLGFLLVLLLTPFAYFGHVVGSRAQAEPPRAAVIAVPSATPRELVTPVCERAVMNRYPTAKLNGPADWLLSQNSAGNYKMLVRFVVPSRLSTPELHWCTVQPVNGVMQLVSLS